MTLLLVKKNFQSSDLDAKLGWNKYKLGNILGLIPRDSKNSKSEEKKIKKNLTNLFPFYLSSILQLTFQYSDSVKYLLILICLN